MRTTSSGAGDQAQTRAHGAIDRSRPLYRDDPVIAALTDEQVGAFVGVLARLARSSAEAELRRRGARERRAAG